MAQFGNCTVRMIYNGKLTTITCPSTTKYEVYLKIAMKRFNIPVEFIDFMQVSSESQYIFDKNTFENYLLYYPQPSISFIITVNYDLLVQDLQNLGIVAPETSNTCNKRKTCDDDNNVGGSVQGMSCPEPTPNCDFQEPIAKRQRVDYPSAPGNGRIPAKSKRIVERNMLTGR